MSRLLVTPPPLRRQLHTRQLPLCDIESDDIDRWESLARRAAEPNPFFEPAVVLAAAKYLGETQTSLLIVEDDDAWRACLPIRAVRLAGVTVALSTWNHLYCFLGTPLIDADGIDEAAKSLLEMALETAPSHLFFLESVTVGGPVANALTAAIRELGLNTVLENTHERALLERRVSCDYLDSMRSHRRRELNRLGRRLEAELGGQLSVTDEAGDEGALDAFLELERSGWKGRGETALGSSPAHTAFFHDVCHAFAAEGRLQLLALYAGKRRVAMKCNFSSGEGVFCFKIGYDEDLARFSPGVQLERENVRVFHEDRDERWQDSCADPQNGMINGLWPDRRRVATAVLARGGVRAAVSRRGFTAAEMIRTTKRRRSSARSSTSKSDDSARASEKRHSPSPTPSPSTHSSP